MKLKLIKEQPAPMPRGARRRAWVAKVVVVGTGLYMTAVGVLAAVAVSRYLPNGGLKSGVASLVGGPMCWIAVYVSGKAQRWLTTPDGYRYPWEAWLND